MVSKGKSIDNVMEVAMVRSTFVAIKNVVALITGVVQFVFCLQVRVRILVPVLLVLVLASNLPCCASRRTRTSKVAIIRLLL